MGRNRKRRPSGREINGILLLDKPPGFTSNAVLQNVKSLYKAAKAGHTGSLDPIATGMLPICFGEATKISAFLLDADKSYEVLCKFGEKTNTADTEGEIISVRNIPALNKSLLQKILEPFLGDIEQIPPMYSALKHEGKRLYDLARQGIEVERKPRPVHIFSIDIIEMSKTTARLQVACTKGTYIRTLVEDIGEAIGCGAHVAELRRLTVGVYRDSNVMISLDDLTMKSKEDIDCIDNYILPLESALSHWPDVHLTADSAFYIRQGQAVQVAKAPSEGMVRIFEGEAEFVGLGQIQEDGKVAPKRIFRVN